MSEPMRRVYCLGPSGLPKIAPHDTLYIATPEFPLRRGILALYKRDGIQICHRVLSRKLWEGEWYYYFKGDNNARADGWIAQSKVLGTVVSRERGGRVVALKKRAPLITMLSLLEDLLFRHLFQSRLALHSSSKPIFSVALQKVLRILRRNLCTR